jgi:rare lipoprotein A
MTFFRKVIRWIVLLSIYAACAAGPMAVASGRQSDHPDHISFSPQPVDFSGETRIGIASFYARRFGGRLMADGTPMRLAGDNAASLTLPLGTVARVTNLATRRSAIVVIRDRGPYVRGRLIDLSPGTAARIGLERREGLATVAVEPLHLPTAGDSMATAGLLDVPASPSW